jgi:hypothetical protein
MKKKLIKESLFDDNHEVNFQEEISYYSDMKDSIEKDDDYTKDFEGAIKEFGLEEENLGIISSYGADSDWEDIKDALNKKDVEYYEFELSDGESIILVNTQDFPELIVSFD